jgi:hypothetical protein
MGKITRKSKFKGQLKAKLKKFKTNDLFAIDTSTRGLNLVEKGIEIEEIKHLKVNYGQN